MSAIVEVVEGSDGGDRSVGGGGGVARWWKASERLLTWTSTMPATVRMATDGSGRWEGWRGDCSEEIPPDIKSRGGQRINETGDALLLSLTLTLTSAIGDRREDLAERELDHGSRQHVGGTVKTRRTTPQWFGQAQWGSLQLYELPDVSRASDGGREGGWLMSRWNSGVVG